MEQTVVKHDDQRDRRIRKIFRIIQIVLLALAGIGLVFGFTIASVFWDTDRNVFWQSAVSMVLLTLPVLLAAGLLEWRIRKLCVEYDYVLSDNVLSVWKISGNRRALYLTVPLSSVTFCKRYDDLEEAERSKLARARFACCNASDPRLALIESNAVRIGKRETAAAVLLEPNEELFRAFRRAAMGQIS